jgi:serine O-acetyltransferase
MSAPYNIAPCDLWPALRREAEAQKKREPAMMATLDAGVLSHTNFATALSHLLAVELTDSQFSPSALHSLFDDCLRLSPDIALSAQKDLIAVRERDPAATSILIPFLFFKGFHALQAYRFAHQLWREGRVMLALSLQGRTSKRFGVDIHPAAQLGNGIMLDHASGIVIGETAVVEDNVSMLHNVTLGGTGKESGDRHPKIRSGVMIGAGAKVLGNIEVGRGARIAAGSVVLDNVLPHVTVAGVPARVTGNSGCSLPSEEMNQMLSGNENAAIMAEPLPEVRETA